MADDMPSQSDQTTAPDSGQDGFDLKYYVPHDLLDVSFPVAVRGYERGAVDAYVKRINRAIAELKVRSSPPAAVRHAVEEAEGTVQGLLQAAREAAEQITTSAQREAEEHTASAKAEAAKLTVDTSADADRMRVEAEGIVADAKKEAEKIIARAQAEADERLQRFEEELTQRREEAEARMRKLQADTNVVWNERRDLLEDIRSMSSDLVELANAAATRIKGEEAADPEEPHETDAKDATAHGAG